MHFFEKNDPKCDYFFQQYTKLFCSYSFYVKKFEKKQLEFTILSCLLFMYTPSETFRNKREEGFYVHKFYGHCPAEFPFKPYFRTEFIFIEQKK